MHALAVDRHVLLVEVPAARAHLQRRDGVVQLVALGAGGGLLLERERAADRLADVDLALDLVGPERRVRVLEVGHVRVGARVERVDDHLGVDRAGDLDATALQGRRHGRDRPVALADGLRLGQEIGSLARVELLRAHGTRREQLLAARLEGAVQLGDERKRVLREDGFEAGQDRRIDLKAGGKVERRRGHGEGLSDAKKSSTSPSCEPMRVGCAPSSSSGSLKRLIQSVV